MKHYDVFRNRQRRMEKGGCPKYLAKSIIRGLISYDEKIAFQNVILNKMSSVVDDISFDGGTLTPDETERLNQFDLAYARFEALLKGKESLIQEANNYGAKIKCAC